MRRREFISDRFLILKFVAAFVGLIMLATSASTQVLAEEGRIQITFSKSDGGHINRFDRYGHPIWTSLRIFLAPITVAIPKAR